MSIERVSKPTNSYSILLDEEERIILKTRLIRENMVDEFIKYNNGVPTKPSDMRVMNEVLNSLDDQTLGLVDRRLKNSEIQSNGDMADVIKNIFTSKVLNSKNGPVTDIDITDKFVPDDVVLDETSVVYKALELEDLNV